MTNKILADLHLPVANIKGPSNLLYVTIDSYPLYKKVIRDFLERTYGLDTTGDRNGFPKMYHTSLVPGRAFEESFLVKNEVSFQFNKTVNEHIIERLSVTFLCQSTEYQNWFNNLSKSESFICEDAENGVFVSKFTESKPPELKLYEDFNPTYKGPDDVPRGAYFKSFKFPVKIAEMPQVLCIGQLKIKLFRPANGQMSISMVMSNVFHRIVTFRKHLRQSLMDLYSSSNIEMDVRIADDSVIMKFTNASLISNAEKYHEFFENTSEIIGNQIRWRHNYSYQEFTVAKDWKDTMIAQFLKDSVSFKDTLLIGAKECGISKLIYNIGNHYMCTIYVI